MPRRLFRMLVGPHPHSRSLARCAREGRRRYGSALSIDGGVTRRILTVSAADRGVKKTGRSNPPGDSVAHFVRAISEKRADTYDNHVAAGLLLPELRFSAMKRHLSTWIGLAAIAAWVVAAPAAAQDRAGASPPSGGGGASSASAPSSGGGGGGSTASSGGGSGGGAPPPRGGGGDAPARPRGTSAARGRAQS